MAVAVIPVALLWYFSGFIMSHLGQEAETVILAESFARMLLPGVPAAMAFELQKKHLQVSRGCSAVIAVPRCEDTLVASPVRAAVICCLQWPRQHSRYR